MIFNTQVKNAVRTRTIKGTTKWMTHLIGEQGGEEKVGKGDGRVRMCRATQKTS